MNKQNHNIVHLVLVMMDRNRLTMIMVIVACWNVCCFVELSLTVESIAYIFTMKFDRCTSIMSRY